MSKLTFVVVICAFVVVSAVPANARTPEWGLLCGVCKDLVGAVIKSGVVGEGEVR